MSNEIKDRYRKYRRNLLAKIKRLEKVDNKGGYFSIKGFDKEVELKIPKKITEGSIKKLEKFDKGIKERTIYIAYNDIEYSYGQGKNKRRWKYDVDESGKLIKSDGNNDLFYFMKERIKELLFSSNTFSGNTKNYTNMVKSNSYHVQISLEDILNEQDEEKQNIYANNFNDNLDVISTMFDDILYGFYNGKSEWKEEMNTIISVIKYGDDIGQLDVQSQQQINDGGYYNEDGEPLFD